MNEQKTLSHLDNQGQANMVDVTEKAVTQRTAIAEGYVHMTLATYTLITQGA
ncbi:MAG: cyclic pyranopterin phosphate synthase, partial [Paraglaciecola sp.]